MAKKKLKRIDVEGLVFSTNPSFDFEERHKPEETISPNKQNLIAKLERKGRGGKVVTIIGGFVGSENKIKDLAKMLKNKCGCGGSVKNNEIVMQGDIRNKVIDILQKENFKIKKSGH